MKGTVVEGTIQKLFEGHLRNYIECVNVDYKSTRNESFYDLQLDFKGCRDIYATFDMYVEVECLEGDNKYQAEEHGLQTRLKKEQEEKEDKKKNQAQQHLFTIIKAVCYIPATENDSPSSSIPLALQSLFYKLQYSDTTVSTKELTKYFGWSTYDSFMRIKQKKLEDKMKDARKGVLYLDFLPVLQLKRFEYDFMRDTMIKIGILLKRFDDERVTKERFEEGNRRAIWV